MFWFRRGRQRPLPAFLARFAGRAIIVHEGLAPDWLEELLRQPGGAGYFRFDARRPVAADLTPIEWVVHHHVLPLALPVPLLVRVGEALHVRHLTRRGRPLHPSEIAWLLDEIEERHHARLVMEGDGLRAVPGMAVEDNAVKLPYE